jgi:predicted double-glycine peptidase
MVNTFSKDMMNDAGKRMQNFIKTNKRLPNTLNMKSREGKTLQLTKAQYAGLFENQNVFFVKHGRQPNYTTLNSNANNPLCMNYQDNSKNCGPASLSMISMLLYKSTSEAAFVKACKTGSNGTSPENMIAGAKSLGFKVSKIDRNNASVKKALNTGAGVLAHIQTKPASCLGYLNDYGHWVVIYGVSSDKYLIADPTKGIKTCTSTILDKATNGRVIYYYKVELF